MSKKITRYTRWLDMLVEMDEYGEVHWCRRLAGLLAAAPNGALRYEPEQYKSGRGVIFDTPGRPAPMRWCLAKVIEHGLLAYVDTFSGDPLPPSVISDLQAVRPHVPELQVQIDAALAQGTDADWASWEGVA